MTNAAVLGSFGDVGGGPLVFRNKLINGDMSIFQRGVAATAINTYAVDRWKFAKVNGATESVSQSTDAPSGYSFSLRDTISVGDASIGATEYSALQQYIEGNNTSDLSFGTSSAKSVTISFWVRSSVIGQYTGNIGNSDSSRLCPFNYTINVANTWEHQKITLPGCPDGTWNAGTTSVSICLQFYSALGSSFLGGTAGVWNSAAQYGSGSPVNGIASNGNIFAITSVQLEAGTCATPFEILPVQTRIHLCQRYYEKSYNLDVAPGTNTLVGSWYFLGASDNTNNLGMIINFKVPKRITPNQFAAYREVGTDGWDYARTATVGNIATASLNIGRLGSSGGLVYGGVGAPNTSAAIFGHWVCASEF